MSDQAGNTQSPHERAAAGIESLFGGGKPPDEDPNAEGLSVATEEGALAEAPGTEAEGQEPALAQSEVAEVEIDGEIYQVPVKIKDRFIQQADYTRKTQDVAELRRALTAERETLQINRAFEQATQTERQQAAVLDAQIAQFKAIDWASMSTEDLLRTRAQFDQLRDSRAEIEKTIEAKRQEFGQRVQGAQRQALEAGAKYIAQHIKDFGDETQKSLMEYGRGEGYQQEELAKIVDPRLVVTMWKAMQWDNLQASAPGVQNKTARASPVIRPGASIKQPSQKQVLAKRIKEAPTGKAKAAAMEDYFAARLSRGR